MDAYLPYRYTHPLSYGVPGKECPEISQQRIKTDTAGNVSADSKPVNRSCVTTARASSSRPSSSTNVTVRTARLQQEREVASVKGDGSHVIVTKQTASERKVDLNELLRLRKNGATGYRMIHL